MKGLGFHTTSKGLYDLIYHEDIRVAEAIGPLDGKGGARGAVVKTKIAENEDPKNRLILELEKGNH